MAQPRRQRLWTDEEKRSICLQTRAPGVSVAQVARRYAMNATLIYKWLNDPRHAPEDEPDAPFFLPVEIGSDNSASAPPGDRARTAACGEGLGRVEILLSVGVHVKVEGGFDGVELGRLVKGLIA